MAHLPLFELLNTVQTILVSPWHRVCLNLVTHTDTQCVCLEAVGYLDEDESIHRSDSNQRTLFFFYNFNFKFSMAGTEHLNRTIKTEVDFTLSIK